MSFLYPRTATIRRPSPAISPAPGAGPYNADLITAAQTVVARGLACSVQFDRAGQRNAVGLPTDAKADPTWRIMFQPGQLADGEVRSADVITDDLGRRFQVFAAIPTSITMECSAILLEV